jgi:hypothetical protein
MCADCVLALPGNAQVDPGDEPLPEVVPVWIWKKCTGTPYVELVFLHSGGSGGHVVHFGESESWNFDTLFSMLGWGRYGSTKSTLGHIMPNLCVLHLVGAAGHIVHSCASGVQNVDALFFMLGWDCYGLDKKRAGTHYAELVFFHPVGYAGRTVHIGAFGVRNVNALFFMLGWDQYGFEKSEPGHVTPYLCFCIQWDMWDT